MLLCQEYMIYLINKYFNYTYKNIISSNIVSKYLTFFPLPTELTTEYYTGNYEINKQNNTYHFINPVKNNNVILYSNKYLPYCYKDPIPFTFPIINSDNDMELLSSNLYYYELTLLERTNPISSNDNISIGYGPITISPKSVIGFSIDSVAFSIRDSSLYYNCSLIDNFDIHVKENDTIGIGIIYIDKNKYKFILTYNGIILVIDHYFILETNSQLLPLISYDHSNKIKLNFGQEPFKFNIKNYLYNNYIVSDINLFIKIEIDNHNLFNTYDVIMKKSTTLDHRFFVQTDIDDI